MSPTQKRDKGEEKLFNKIVGENIPHLQKEIDIQTQEAQKVPNKTNTKISVSRYIPIIIKMTKIKDKEIILKAKRSKMPFKTLSKTCRGRNTSKLNL